jgi:preprotein translocase subunit YajC
MITGILVPISFFASFVAIFYFFFITRNKERLSLIENDKNASIFFKNIKNSDEKKFRINYTLKFGLFFIGIGIGIVIGNIVALYSRLEEPTSYISMIFIFGGLGLISYYLIEKKIKSRNK